MRRYPAPARRLRASGNQDEGTDCRRHAARRPDRPRGGTPWVPGGLSGREHHRRSLRTANPGEQSRLDGRSGEAGRSEKRSVEEEGSVRLRKRMSASGILITAVTLAALGGIALAAQDKYTVQVPGGLAFSDFRG